MSKIVLPLVALVTALVSFTAVSHAAGAVSPDDGSLLDLAKPVLDAIMNGRGAYAAALALVLCVAAARRYLPGTSPKFAWIKSDAGTTLTTFLMAFGGALATSLAAAGSVPSMAMLGVAATVALGASGGYQAFKHLLAPALRWAVARFPRLAAPLKLLLWVVDGNSSRVADAEKAGDAAVAAHPGEGIKSVTGAPREVK